MAEAFVGADEIMLGWRLRCGSSAALVRSADLLQVPSVVRSAMDYQTAGLARPNSTQLDTDIFRSSEPVAGIPAHCDGCDVGLILLAATQKQLVLARETSPSDEI